MSTTDRGIARFNVSDALDVPLRGFLLRLRRIDGEISVKEIGPGTRLRLTSPEGHERTVTVRALSLTGGRNGAERFAKTGQVDLIIGTEEAYAEELPIGIGWTAEGPLRDAEGRPIKGRIESVRRRGRRATRDSPTGGWPFHPPGGANS